MSGTPSELVCFDLGRVLVRLRDDLPEACDAAGVGVPVHIGDAALRAEFMELLDAHERGQVTQLGFVGTFARLMQVSVQEAEQVWRAWLAGRYAGAAELLSGLSAQPGVVTACLSNTSALHWGQMFGGQDPENALPADALDWCFASHLIGHRKPEAAIYQHVENHTSMAPQRIHFFDDRQDNIEAAASRGWNAHLVQRCANPIPVIRRTLSAQGLLEPAAQR